MNLLEELKRRNVVRVGIAYVLLIWVLIQVTDTVAPVFHLPEWTLAFVTWIGIIGLPIVLIFSWVFELTPEGLKREVDIDRTQSITSETGRKINYVVIGLLAVAVIVLLVDRQTDDAVPDAAAPTVVAEDAAEESGYDSIGVLPFVNMSDDPSQEYFSDGISEELLNALAKLKGLQVAARTSSFAFKGQNQDITAIGKTLNVDTVLEGSVRKAGSTSITGSTSGPRPTTANSPIFSRCRTRLRPPSSMRSCCISMPVRWCNRVAPKSRT